MFTVSEKLRFITSMFGGGNVARNATNIEVLCPFCAEAARARGDGSYSKKKLAIRLSDDLVHCWVCGWKSRSLVPLIKKFGSAEDLRFYKEKFNPTVSRESGDEAAPVLKLPADFKLLATSASSRDRDVRSAIRYLYERGLTERHLWYFKFGISREMPDRVVFPSFDSTGKLNYWTARTIFDAHPKYINPDKEVVKKTEIIFNEINIDWNKELVLVEGPFDLTKCPENSVPLQGNQISEEGLLFNQIVMHETPCVVMLDDDARVRASEIAKKLVSYNVPTKVASLGKFHDPGEMTHSDVRKAVAEAQPWSWEDHMREKFNSILL